MLSAGQWTNLKGEDGSLDTSTSFNVVGLTPDTYYSFRVRAYNLHGWSKQVSDVFTTITAIAPGQPIKVTTQLTNKNIRISWTKPFNNYQPILEYKILIQNSLATGSSENTVFCDGSKYIDSTTDLFCDIPVQSVLRQTPYNLAFN